MKRLIFALSLIALAGFGFACDKNKKDSDEEPTASESTASGGEAESSDDEEAAEGSEESESDGKTGSAEVDEALLNPEEADKEAPEAFEVRFETSAGEFVGEFHREWAPKGADRLYNLVKLDFYDDVAFFRVIDGFMAQFGMKGVPKVDAAWQEATIEDDPVEKSNTKGMITFAKRKSPDTRSTQLFVNYSDNSESLDKRGFAPVGEVVEGMDVVEDLYAGYGEGAPRGDGPSQKKLREEGNPYLKEKFPKLDWLESASIVDQEQDGEQEDGG